MHTVIQSNIHVVATAAVTKMFHQRVPRIADLLIRKIRLKRLPTEIACLHFEYEGVLLVFSSWLTKYGVPVIEIDVGDPRYAKAGLISMSEHRDKTRNAHKALNQYGRNDKQAPAKRPQAA
jgi:hypothetical protein